jgi:flagellar basal-body rod protein FlgB
MINRLFDTTLSALERGIAYATRRHEVIARNVANMETPGYRAEDVVFDDALRPLMASMPAQPLGGLLPGAPAGRPVQLIYSEDAPPGDNGNDVQLDKQMARLAENAMFHNALVQILAGQINSLKQAISGRV